MHGNFIVVYEVSVWLSVLPTHQKCENKCLNSMHQRHFAKWLNYPLFSGHSFFFFLDQSFNRCYGSQRIYFVLLHVFMFTFFVVFDLSMKIELPSVISFHTIVSIMMISKWIKRQSLHKFFPHFSIQSIYDASSWKMSQVSHILEILIHEKKNWKSSGYHSFRMVHKILEGNKKKLLPLADHSQHIIHFSCRTLIKWLK